MFPGSLDSGTLWRQRLRSLVVVIPTNGDSQYKSISCFQGDEGLTLLSSHESFPTALAIKDGPSFCPLIDCLNAHRLVAGKRPGGLFCEKGRG